MLTASTAEKGDENDWDVDFTLGSETGTVIYAWMYGNKPNKMLGFLFWTVLILGVVGGAAYFLM